MRRVVVTGGRHYEDYARVLSVLADLDHDCVIVHGGASGADSLASRAAQELGLGVEIYLPNWSRYGRAAGPMRNQLMVMNASLVIAFPGGRGTRSCILAAERIGVPVQFVGPYGTNGHPVDRANESQLDLKLPHMQVKKRPA